MYIFPQLMYTLCGELKNLPQQYISNLSPACPPPLTGACNLSSTPALFPKTRTLKPRAPLALHLRASASFLFANTRVPRFHKTRFLFERTRELTSHRRRRCAAPGPKRQTLSSLKLAGVAADADETQVRPDATQPSWKSFPSPPLPLPPRLSHLPLPPSFIPFSVRQRRIFSIQSAIYTPAHFETSLRNLDCVVRQARKLARRAADSDFDWDAPNDLHIVFLGRRRAPLSLRR